MEEEYQFCSSITRKGIRRNIMAKRPCPGSKIRSGGAGRGLGRGGGRGPIGKPFGSKK